LLDDLQQISDGDEQATVEVFAKYLQGNPERSLTRMESFDALISTQHP